MEYSERLGRESLLIRAKRNKLSAGVVKNEVNRALINFN